MEIQPRVIRALTSNDLAELEKHFPQPKQGMHARRLELQQKGKQTYSGIIVNGSIAGVQLIRWGGPIDPDNRKYSTYPEISSVYVLPEFRKQGLAIALLHNGERLIKERGFNASGLLIKDSNIPSINLHVKNGYVAVGAAKPSRSNPDEPRTYYTKSL